MVVGDGLRFGDKVGRGAAIRLSKKCISLELDWASILIEGRKTCVPNYCEWFPDELDAGLGVLDSSSGYDGVLGKKSLRAGLREVGSLEGNWG